MTNLYDDFEKRFTNEFFSSGWSEIEVKPQKAQNFHKDLAVLETELSELNEKMDIIAQKQLMLSNLAKLYN